MYDYNYLLFNLFFTIDNFLFFFFLSIILFTRATKTKLKNDVRFSLIHFYSRVNKGENSKRIH